MLDRGQVGHRRYQLLTGGDGKDVVSDRCGGWGGYTRALLDIENMKIPQEKAFPGGLVARVGVLGRILADLPADLPAHYRGGFLAFPHTAAARRTLAEGEPPGRRVVLGAEQRDVMPR